MTAMRMSGLMKVCCPTK
jgi:hypothetical protein